jgi:hypothetical protein
MWEQYRTTLVPMQLFILAACAAVLFLAKAHWLAVLLMFLVMQAGAVGGAWWEASHKRRIEGRQDRLPLQGRRR